MSNLFGDKIEEDTSYEPEQLGSLKQEETFLSPKESNFYISDQAIEESFLSLISKEKLPHAVIFSGPKGIGKATFAYRLARYALKYVKSINTTNSLFGDSAPVELPETMDMDPEDAVFRRIVSGGHADFLALEPMEEKKGLDVTQIRKVAPFLHKTASEEGAWQVVLIDDANTMNRNAQNALLKILEEPPEKALLILISHNDSAFLPTIRSRVRVYPFTPPGLEIYETLLKRKDPNMSRDNIKFLYEYSSGSIGKTIEFIDYNGVSLMEELVEHLKSFPNTDFENIHLFCEQFNRSKEEQTWHNFCDLFIWILQTLTLNKAKNTNLPSKLEDLGHLNNLWSLEEQLEICQMLEDKLKRANYANLDKRQAALELFIILHQDLKK